VLHLLLWQGTVHLQGQLLQLLMLHPPQLLLLGLLVNSHRRHTCCLLLR
jgi:hypothetical protein